MVTKAVLLAAGRGTRFGGFKQLVAVRPDGATLTDVLIERATDAGAAAVDRRLLQHGGARLCLFAIRGLRTEGRIVQ